MYYARTLESYWLEVSRQFPLLLTGPCQVGKTTLLRHLAEDARRYVSLDNPVLRDLANDDPALFLQRYEPPVLIDEIQYAPGLLPLIKMIVDDSRGPGLFWRWTCCSSPMGPCIQSRSRNQLRPGDPGCRPSLLYGGWTYRWARGRLCASVISRSPWTTMSMLSRSGWCNVLAFVYFPGIEAASRYSSSAAWMRSAISGVSLRAALSLLARSTLSASSPA